MCFRSCFESQFYKSKWEFVILSEAKDLVTLSAHRTKSHEIFRFAQDDKLPFLAKIGVPKQPLRSRFHGSNQFVILSAAKDLLTVCASSEQILRCAQDDKLTASLLIQFRYYF